MDQIGYIWVRNNLFQIACDLYIRQILWQDPYAVDVDTLCEEYYNIVYNNLSTAIKGFDISKAAFPRVSVYLFEALLSSTDNQARESPNSCQCVLHRSAMWNYTQPECHLFSDQFKW